MLYGAKNKLVDVDENVRLLGKTGNPNIRIRVFENANHNTRELPFFRDNQLSAESVYSGETCHGFRLKGYHLVSFSLGLFLNQRGGSFRPEFLLGFLLMDSPLSSI